ncbi:hypothetical protein [Streptomyces sp. NPDC055692]|uniref:hypothetical protein n=1 Tax=Streptomyces sp. NPDC055692 TaxID=3155683 RepID=UPI0034181788
MATDTFAVEVLPVLADSDFHHSAPEDQGMMHQELSPGRWDSLLTVKPLNLTGGVGSPANATALR